MYKWGKASTPSSCDLVKTINDVYKAIDKNFTRNINSALLKNYIISNQQIDNSYLIALDVINLYLHILFTMYSLY